MFICEGVEWLTKGQELVCTFPVPVSLTDILMVSLAPWGKVLSAVFFVTSLIVCVWHLQYGTICPVGTVL